MGKEEEEKSGGKEKIFFGRKNFFYTTEKCTLWVRQGVELLTTLYGGARRRLVEGFYEVSDMELLIGVGGNKVSGNKVGGNYG